ncbi:MAG: aldehyde dehydrogenase, partial [Flavobacteriales bacterium]
MTIKGANFIGFAQSARGTEFFKAFSPERGIELEENFSIATTEEFNQALHLAKKAFVELQHSNPHTRA